jgi:hypothetical protein
MYFDPSDTAAIKQHLRQRGIRGCSTCGESELEPVVHGFLNVEPVRAAPEKPRVVLVGCQSCGRILLFAADAIEGLQKP